MKITLALLALAIPTSLGAEAAPKAASPAPRASAPAPAPTPTAAGCLLVSNAFAKHGTEEKDRTVAQSVLYFFLGRIGDRTTLDQFRSELEQQGKLLTAENAAPLMNACLHEMQTKATMLQNAAQQLQRGK